MAKRKFVARKIPLAVIQTDEWLYERLADAKVIITMTPVYRSRLIVVSFGVTPRDSALEQISTSNVTEKACNRAQLMHRVVKLQPRHSITPPRLCIRRKLICFNRVVEDTGYYDSTCTGDPYDCMWYRYVGDFSIRRKGPPSQFFVPPHPYRILGYCTCTLPGYRTHTPS